MQEITFPSRFVYRHRHPPRRQSAAIPAFPTTGRRAGAAAEGTGLGLSICASLVKLMGERLQLKV